MNIELLLNEEVAGLLCAVVYWPAAQEYPSFCAWYCAACALRSPALLCLIAFCRPSRVRAAVHKISNQIADARYKFILFRFAKKYSKNKKSYWLR